MKYAKFSIVLCLILVIITVLPVFGQGDYPPQLSEPLESNVSPFASVPEIKKEPLGQSSEPESRTVIPQPRDLVEVETRWTDRYSAADHGENYVAVAHDSDGNIRVFIYWYGVFINRFEVSEGDGNSRYPDVAYEASSGLFIVTWSQYDPTEGWNIEAIAVDPNSWLDPIVGSIVEVASSAYNETDPSVDCNFYDQSCLIAYNVDNAVDFFRIDGRYMKMDSNTGVDVGDSSPNFAISNLENEYDPHVAWGPTNNNYMVAYTWPATGGGEHYPVFSVVMDYYYTELNTDLPVLNGTSYAISTDWFNDNDKLANGIAYENCSETYVIVFVHDFNGDSSDNDIYTTAVDGENYTLHGLTPIAWSLAQEVDADISYLKDADAAAINPNPDKLVIAYHRYDNQDMDEIVATDLRGNCNPDYLTYSIDPYSKHYVVIDSPGVSSPSITGGGNWWEFFVAFTYLDGSDYDIYGRYMDAADKTYVPMVNH